MEEKLLYHYTSQETLQMYLQSKNYTDVDIPTSEVPIRY